MTITAVQSKIGAQDIMWRDECRLPNTFTRLTSSGGSLTLNRFGNTIDALLVYGSGADYTSDTLNASIAAISTQTVSVEIAPGTWTIATNVTFPSNITVIMRAGAILQIADGYKVTFNGPFECGPYQCFIDQNTDFDGVVFGVGAVKEVYPEWWAVNTTPGTTDMTGAIWCAITAAKAAHATLKFSGTRYYSGKWPDIGERWMSITGEPDNSSIIIFDVDADNCIEIVPEMPDQTFVWADL